MGLHAGMSTALETWCPLKGICAHDENRCFVPQETDMTGLFPCLSAQIEENLFLLIGGTKWMLVWFQTKRCSSSEHHRLRSVSTLNIKELMSFLIIVFGRFMFFQWNIWGLFDLKGKATIWGLIPPKESSVAVDELESLGKVSTLPVSKRV